MKTVRMLAGVLAALILSGCAGNAEASLIYSEADSSREEERMEIAFTEADLQEDFDKANAIRIRLFETEAEVEGSGATFADGVLTIQRSGTYILSGTLDEGKITVTGEDHEPVRLILNGVSVNGSAGPLLQGAKEAEIILTAVTGTKNSFHSSAEDPVLETSGDLVINGGGGLEVLSEAGDGIHTGKDLRMLNAIVTVTAGKDGIAAEGKIGIRDCILCVNAEEDGLKAMDSMKPGEGVLPGSVLIDGGVLTVRAGKNGIRTAGKIESEKAEVNIEAGESRREENVSSLTGSDPYGKEPV